MKTALRTTAATIVVALGATGCSSDPSDTSFDAIAANPTPDIRSTSERPVDIDRNLAVTNNTNWRSMWSDLGRTFYTDHPSRLSPYPIMSLSGQPR